MTRRWLAIVVAVIFPCLLLGTVTFFGRDAKPAVVPTFAAAGVPSMPFVPHRGFITSNWFCPGVPVGGEGLGGSVTIANTGDAPLNGHVTVFSDAAGAGTVESAFEVPARGTKDIDLAQLQPSGTYVSAMVEIVGGGGFVEQQAQHPAGNAVSPCSNSTSGQWYFADGYTLNDSTEDIIVTNPFPDDAIVDFGFGKADSSPTSQRLLGVPVPAQSILVVDNKFLPKDETLLAVSITATRGRVVAARAQHFLGERGGYTMGLGAPSGSTDWTFADGDNPGGNYFERYSIYNPGDQDVVVLPSFYGLGDTAFTEADSITVQAHRVASLSISDIPDLPSVRHGALFTSETGAPIVVERAITRQASDDSFSTTVVRGVEHYFASVDSGYFRWSMAIGTDLAVDNVLVVLNLSFTDTTVAVKALGPGGEVDVPGLEAVTIPPNGIVSIAIPDEAAVLGHPLIVVGNQPIVVERLLPRGGDLRGRSGSMALPG